MGSEDTSGLLLGPHSFAYSLKLAPHQVQQLTTAEGIASINQRATVLYYKVQVRTSMGSSC